ncbi:uncharacterized protein L201_003597 [Kwoniella dendrophila CBS 6074]|uniref:Leucine-rich repeat-containing N-terminal plant-type domain-containing protein n=1 Tax=Kwoniella dendrophila CBS 6074 TaxID=1295534 RepID=A0AAX4JUW1_9TREE
MRSTTLIPLQILFTILLFLSLQESTQAITLPFFSKSTTSPSFIRSSNSNVNSNSNSKRYLSSSKRIGSPKRYGYFSFSRHPKSLPDWNPLDGIENVLIHRGLYNRKDLKPESSTSTIRPNTLDKPKSQGHHQITEDKSEREEKAEEEEEELVERNGEFELEDCEKRQEGELTNPALLPIAQLGSIPEKQLELGQLGQTIIQSADRLSTAGSNEDNNTLPMDVRKHNDKILWSGIENLLPLEKGLFKRHSDKSGNGRKHKNQDNYDYNADHDQTDYNGRGNRNRKGNHNYNDGGQNDDSRGSGRYGKHNKGYNSDSSGGGGSGGHNGGWKDKHYGGGRGGYSKGDNWHGSGNGSSKGKYQQDWEESPSSSTSNYHHNGYNSQSGNKNNGDNDNGWHHSSSNHADAYDGNDNDNDSGKGWGDHKSNKPKYDDGQYHPWKSNTGSNKDHKNSNGNGNGNDNDNWHKPYSSSTESNGNNDQNDEEGNHFESNPNIKGTTIDDYRRSDCTNLSNFYRSFKEDWKNGQGWTNDYDDYAKDCCNWFGVQCDSKTKRVISLNLRNNGLKGNLDQSLFNVDTLIKLDLSENELTSIPDTFSKLNSLTHLIITNSGLESIIPNSIFNMKNLISIDLSNNKLNGQLNLPSTTSLTLKSIDISNNKLDGFTINSFQSNISKINLRNNSIIGYLPDLSNSKSLQSLDLSLNNTGPLFDISQLSNLTRIDVRSNQLTGSFPDLPPSIQSIYLSNNQFTGTIPSISYPSGLTNCYVLPNPFHSCPSKDELNDYTKLASKCHLRSCGKSIINSNSNSNSTPSTNTSFSPLNGQSGSGTTIDASQITSTSLPNSQTQKGIPVYPLPGENLNNSPYQQQQPQQQGDSSKVIQNSNNWPGIKPQTQNQNQNQNSLNQNQRLGSTKLGSSSNSVRLTSIIVSSQFPTFGILVSSILFGCGIYSI